MSGGGAGTSLVARTLAVLQAFDETHPRLTLTLLADRAGLPAPTALRIVRVLVDGGALTRDDDGGYRIGRTIWQIGLLSPVETDLRDVASPFLHDLHAATRATVHLAVRDGDLALYLDRVSGRSSVPVVSRVGGHLPLHSTGVGKVLLAHAPERLRQQVLAAPLAGFTPYTVTHPGRLARQLARVRTDGYAWTRQEMTYGACSVAVPVTDDGVVVAAIGVVVADLRRERPRLVTGLQVAAQGIERRLAASP